METGPMNLAPLNPLPRLGPRPLALHLANASLSWLSSQAALPLLKNGSLPWKPELAQGGRDLLQSLGSARAEEFAPALERELRRRADLFLTGIEAYRRHPYRRHVEDMPLLWQEGTTRLFDYAPSGGDPVLVVPSLINRGYILDLSPGNSLLRFLAGQRLRPFLVDWDVPGEVERRYGLTEYITLRLEKAAEAASRASGGKNISVLGYCMGGLLALALADRRSDLVNSLALLATPWKFHAERPEQARLLGALARPFAASFAGLGEVPVDVLQSLFASLDPLLAVKKFSRFATMPPHSESARGFVALEDWLNDGVPLALPAAVECLGDWYGLDTPGRGEWRVAGRAVLPRNIAQPSLVMVPAQDRIVPPLSAAALAEELPNAERFTPPLGHIGMVVAHEAPKEVWPKLAGWLKGHAAR
ncbi:MAG: alpha/beta fold hydrolase [Stellaceae bacterium]